MDELKRGTWISDWLYPLLKLVAVFLVLMSSNVFAETLTGFTKTITTMTENYPTGRSSGYSSPAVDYVFDGTIIDTETITFKNNNANYSVESSLNGNVKSYSTSTSFCDLVSVAPYTNGGTVGWSYPLEVLFIGNGQYQARVLNYTFNAGKTSYSESGRSVCVENFTRLYVVEGSNHYLYSDYCRPNFAVTSLKVQARYHNTVSTIQSGQVLLNGNTPNSGSGYWLSTWNLPITNCNDAISLSFTSTIDRVNGTFYVIPVYENCVPLINSFSASSYVIKPYSGDGVNFAGTIFEAFGQPVSWNVTVAGRSFVGNGKQVSFAWDGRDNNGLVVPDGAYQVTLNAKTVDGSCTESKSISITVKSSCDLEAVLTGPGKDLSLGTGSSFQISGSYSTSSSDPVNWTLTLPDGSITNGTGMPVSAIWNGNNANGTLADIGTYSAILTVTSSTDSTCTASSTLPITVTQPPDQCGLNVSFGSTAHVANGNLSHSQELFTTRGGALPLGMSLHYNSRDSINSSLGRGWSHDYDYLLTENRDGSVLISKPNWRHDFFTFSEGGYSTSTSNYSTLAKNEDGMFALTHKDGQVYTFANGKIATITDRNSNTTIFAYSDGGNLATVTDPSGRVITFVYDETNHLTSLTDPSGNVYAFTVGDTLTSVTQPDGGAWHYTYDANSFMLTKADPLGNVTSYAYDDQHRVTTATDPEGKTRSITYPQTSDTVKTTSFTEKDGGVWNYSYDTSSGYLLGKTDPQSGNTSYGYDANGNRTSTTNPDGTKTSATYDGTGNMLTSTDALGQTTGYAYNSFGQVTGITDTQGGTTAYAYDTKGNLTALTDPTGATTKYAYDVKGNITKVTDPAALVTSFTYDATGNLATATDSSGATSTYGYDVAGNVTSITDAKGAVNQFIYDNRNRLIKSIDPNGNATLYSYDANGNKLSDTDANGNATKYEYNGKNQLIKTIDALNNATNYSYGGSSCPSCGGGNGEKLTTLTDANGNSTSYLYDQLGRLSKETDPKGNATSYAYDAKGNLTGKTDANGNTTSYSYDGNGRLVKKTYPDGTEESYTYDAKGNILNATNKDIVYNFTYDSANRMTSSMDSNSRYLQYSYDTTGKKTKTIYPEGSVVSYAYDTTGRLSTITNGGGRTYSYAYDKLGRRSKLTYPSGATANYAYDTAGRLTSLDHKQSNGKTIASFAYTHDNVGNRLTKTEPDGKTSYGYDAIYRLLQAQSLKPNGREKEDGSGTEKYSYDSTGNRLTGSDRHTEYTYGPGNELLTARHTQFSYDRNGNQIEKTRLHQEEHNKGEHGEHDNKHQDGKKWTYTYDFENRLIKAETRHEDETIFVSFKYDPLGRRIEKKIEKIEHGKVEDTKIYTYVYDGQNIILEYANEKDDDHRPKTRTAKYVHGSGIDEHLSMERNGEVLFYHQDGLGSVVALTDKKQGTVEKYEYDSFGNQKGDVKPIQLFTYTGQIWDTEIDLYDYRARTYDSRLGRFIQKDPAGFRGGINLYSYVQNNPVNRIDPTGLSDLLFDRGTGTLTAFDNQGNQVAQFPAGNNTTTTSKGPWPNGTYNFSHYNEHPESGSTGPYGSYGIFVFNVPGRTGMGVHSGRSGPKSKTLGCVRTTENAMDSLYDLHLIDPIKTITIR